MNENYKEHDWLFKSEEKKIKQNVLITNLKKEQFIQDVKNGLGNKILEEPNKLQEKMGFWKKLKKIFS